MDRESKENNAKKKKVSLKDIARAAGASPSAVSFVLNGKQKQYRVSDELARRIKEIARELDYTPNDFARSLRKGTNHTIGVVVSDISNQFFADLVRNIEITAEEFGYMALFASSDEDRGRMAELVDKMINKGVDGLILVPCAGADATVELLLGKGIPFVLLDRYVPGIKTSYVALDNFKAGYDATMHLLKQGFSKIALVCYDTDLVNIKGRESGYKAAVRDAGMPDGPVIRTVTMSNLEKSCNKAMQGVLEAGADAILFATNSITIQCLKYINAHGIRIPEDIGLVGFDGGSVFDFFYAPLTYVDQPLEKMARKSVEVLIDALESGQNMVQSIEMEGTLIERKSSSRPKKTSL